MMRYYSGLFTRYPLFQHTFLDLKAILLLTMVSFVPLVGSSAIRIDYPSERAVYQRDVTGYGTITVAGTYSSAIDRVEVRAVPVYPGQGIEVDWTTLSSNPQGGVFSGQVRLMGGWYTILVRGSLSGVVVEQAAVNRMGVGEVFIIAGQSNAQGIRGLPNGPPAQDERVNYITNNQNVSSSLADPDPPTFAHLNSSDAHLSPMGQGAWCWGVLGDRLVQKINVPVLFINASWEGTTIRNWSESSRGEPTFNAYGGFQYPANMPYANLAISVRYYANMLGVRSILWMQGETDNFPVGMSRSDYASNLQYLLNKLTADIEGRIIWTIARTSRTSTTYTPSGSITNQEIINAQNDVLSVPFNNVYPGPYTDDLGNPRPDGIHFGSGEALTSLADAWNSVMDFNYFANITPLTPASIPAITARCATNNTSAVIELPQGYSSYRWSTGATSRSITVTSPGTYFATLKTNTGMTVVTSPIRIETLKPERPAIIPARDSWTCADSDFEFSVNGQHEYTWMNDGAEVGKGRKWATHDAGTYTVRSTNVLGCVSDVSVARKLTVLPQVSKPVLGQGGPFSLLAATEGDSVSITYQWYKNDVLIPSVTQDVYKVSDLATGENGMYTVTAFAHFPTGSTTTTCESGMSEPYLYTFNPEDDIVVFPVPAPNREVFIESREPINNVSVIVYDLLGRNVANEFFTRLDARVPIPLPLSRGIYLLRIQTGEKEFLKRIILQ